MENRDYVVLIDENGQPYIAHGVFSNIGNRIKNSKYYQKIKTGYGWRYFYDPEEWKAYVNGGKDAAAPKSLVGRVKDKLGFDERARAQQAASRADNASVFTRGRREKQAAEAQAEYDRTALGRAEKLVSGTKGAITDASGKVRGAASTAAGAIKRYGDTALSAIRDAYGSVRNTASSTAGRLKSAGSGAVDRVKDVLGFDERERAQQAAARADSAGFMTRAARQQEADAAQAEYNRTALGRAEGALSSVRGAANRAGEAISGAAGRAGEAISGAAGRAGEAISGAAGRADSAVSGAASSAMEKLRDGAAAVADATYAKEAKADYDAAVREYERVQGTGSDVELEAYWNMMNAQYALDRARGLLG